MLKSANLNKILLYDPETNVFSCKVNIYSQYNL